ncbi:MAG: hypothetical protein U0169_21025 [Polyangiaceae bacterium]
MSEKVLHVNVVERDEVSAEWSSESFDRIAFAESLLERLRPTATRIALCRGLTKVRTESGRLWPETRTRWALLSIPPHASRRAIAFGIVELCRGAEDFDPWVLDALVGPYATP